jgi:calcineurin-like phosphoesterase family protein
MEHITSDLHAYHKGILQFCPKTRPFSSIEEMNEQMILDWNRIVQPQDIVWILGDVSFGTPSQTYAWLSQLNGVLKLVRGNHDGAMLKCDACRSLFAEIYDYKETIVNKTKVCMFHYPILEWNACHRGSVLLHGHCHGDATGLEQYRALDVGVDANGVLVSPLVEIVERAKLGEIKRRMK